MYVSSTKTTLLPTILISLLLIIPSVTFAQDNAPVPSKATPVPSQVSQDVAPKEEQKSLLQKAKETAAAAAAKTAAAAKAAKEKTIQAAKVAAEKASEVANTAKEKASEAAKAVAETASEAASTAKEKVGQAATAAKEVGKKAIKASADLVEKAKTKIAGTKEDSAKTAEIEKPKPTPVAPAKPKVKFTTNLGEFTVELNPKAAPVTVKNFMGYVDAGFYNGTIFHRVISSFMIQGGGFTADMTKKTTKAPIILEAKNGLSNVRGTIAMARTGNPNSATSQFFINVVHNRNLDSFGGGYAVFGEVISGMETVDKIRAVGTTKKSGHRDVPVDTVVIQSATRL